jgi:hypothetical protein
MTCTIELELGAYVLNALEPDEADAVRQHLLDCPICRAEVTGLADTASMLERLTLADIEQFFDLDVRRDATRPRRHRAALAIAAGVLAASAGVGAVRMLNNDHHGPKPAVVQAVDPVTHVRAEVTMTGQSGVTQLHLTLAGAYPSGACLLVAHSRTGQSDTAATWIADPHGGADVVGTTAIAPAELSELDVVTNTGVVLVHITVPQHHK